MEKIIEISRLYKSYGDVKAVQDLSFHVKKGELFAFLGLNGAGKSTTISIMCGQQQKDGGRVATNEVAPKKEERLETVVEGPEFASETVDFAPPEMEAPPDEAVTGGNVYFDEEYAPKKREIAKTVESAPAPRREMQAVKGDAMQTFGRFLRSLRTTGKNGVIYTLCMDLECFYENELFVLETESERIFLSLKKDEHYALLKNAFSAIGVDESGFELRMKGKKSDDFNKSVEEIKQTFRGVKVEIR